MELEDERKKLIDNINRYKELTEYTPHNLHEKSDTEQKIDQFVICFGGKER